MGRRGRNEELKRLVEMSVAHEFAAFLRAKGHEIDDPRPGDVNWDEPDAVCDSPDGPIGIEVAGAYYNPGTAKWYWSWAREGDAALQRMGHGQGLYTGAPGADSLVDGLNRTLAEHCRHTYSVAAYLVLNVGHERLVDQSDAPHLVRGLVVPDGCPFQGVYIRPEARVFIQVHPSQDVCDG